MTNPQDLGVTRSANESPRTPTDVTPGPPAVLRSSHSGVADPAQPPAILPHNTVLPGATGDTLAEVARRIERNQIIDPDPQRRSGADRLWHLELLLGHVRRCRRGGLPYRNALIGIAVQAVMWAAALEERP